MKSLAVSVLLATVALGNGDVLSPLADSQSTGSLPTAMQQKSALGNGLKQVNVVDIFLHSAPIIFNALRKLFFGNLRLSQVGEVFIGMAAVIRNKSQITNLARLLAHGYFIIGCLLSFFRGAPL